MTCSCYIKFPIAERPKKEADKLHHYNKSLLRELIYEVCLGYQQDDMDILHTTWQALRGYIGQGKMVRDTGV